ncbi:ribonuclease H-like domain-containing protein, partial [Lipomyces tetrasporus]
VWADGCALSNGLFGARAGVGVYFREDDPRNLSEPLSGYQQTNQRAELTAILRALEVIDDPGRHVRITTDSQYAIKCLTVWKDKWLQNGFINSKGLEVVNSDIIKEILELMASHRENRGYVELEHVYGHSGNVGNEVADALAKAGA